MRVDKFNRHCYDPKKLKALKKNQEHSSLFTINVANPTIDVKAEVIDDCNS